MIYSFFSSDRFTFLKLTFFYFNIPAPNSAPMTIPITTTRPIKTYTGMKTSGLSKSVKICEGAVPEGIDETCPLIIGEKLIIPLSSS